MFLARQAHYNHGSLVIDETQHEFLPKTETYPASKYPSSLENMNFTTSAPFQEVHSHWQRMQTFANVNESTNISESFLDGSNRHHDGLAPQNVRYRYKANAPQPHPFQDVSRSFGPSTPHFRTNFIWNRDVNKFTYMLDRVKRSELFRRHMREIRESPFKKNFTGEVKYKRSKRQNGEMDGETLCQTTSKFIMPKTALNKHGAWMYVVNMENTNEKYTQLVKSEVCVAVFTLFEVLGTLG
ncbi:hypothetical protein HHI36_014917 [Cryptolaemus montrouzieri]|uniref:Spaetzle domain-containing protein n=1 Tax=Cryptolaemus montrouzieri TaxID=559131 RepID=A0ABD2N470_9CUCU